ncbi:MAG TPA: reverse transcriptase domain-containing protein [Pyrinomonadaceae bacterium]|nr:reverse transcriptase domain-containing protein [Pyrinomonadaceae bacterium]
MSTGLERITAKARQESKLCFTSLAHHIDATRLWQNLCHVPPHTAPGSDGQTVDDLKQVFVAWSATTLRAVHTQGYRPPPVRRTYIPKPGKQALRPLGVPCVGDRVLQRSVADVLTAIYEQDFLPCSCGGRPGIGAHHALATLHEVIAGKPVSWVYEADLRNFFGSLDHGWLLRFVQLRVGDPRILCLIRRWLKAGVLEDGIIEPSEEGVPQGGSISVVLSNLYLHYVLDLWFKRIVKPRLQGEAYLMRYIDDFVVCFQYQADAQRFEQVLVKRLTKFALTLEPTKTRLVAFGRFAERDAKRHRRRRETFAFLGFPLYCTRNHRGNFKVGWRTDKSRLRRSLAKFHQLLQIIRHEPLKDQAEQINQVLRGHYAYYGVAGNVGSLLGVYRHVERYWREMLSSRSQKGKVRWEVFLAIKRRYPLQRPKLSLPYTRLKQYAVL